VKEFYMLYHVDHVVPCTKVLLRFFMAIHYS
jgi:hypothetical protein